jgi:hypothetical protein
VKSRQTRRIAAGAQLTRFLTLDSDLRHPVALSVHVEPVYVREKAQRCVALARSCPDSGTSHALEALAIEFMERAAELEQYRSLNLSLRRAKADHPDAKKVSE